MKNLILITTFSLTALLCGCITSMQSDDGLHIATKMGLGTFDDPYVILSDVQENARRFCAKTGQVIGMATAEAVQGTPGLVPAHAKLKFRCVSP